MGFENEEKEGIHPFIRKLWDAVGGFPHVQIIVLNSMFKKFVRRAIEESKDPTLIEDKLWDVDRTLQFSEMINYLEDQTHISYESEEKELTDYALMEEERVAALDGRRVLEEKEYEKLLGWESKAMRNKEKIKDLRREIERLQNEKVEDRKEAERRLAETARRLKLDTAISEMKKSADILKELTENEPRFQKYVKNKR